MAKLIGVSGAHGTGKSTVLKHLTNMALPGVVVDSFSVPRSVQGDYGMPLAEIVADSSRVPEYQDKIAQRKNERQLSLREESQGDVIIFSDRTPIDFYAYSKTWVGENELYREWFTEYTESRLKEVDNYDLILLIPPREFPFVAQAQRGSAETQALNHNYCVEFVSRLSRDVRSRIYLVESLSVEDRAAEFLRYAGYKSSS